MQLIVLLKRQKKIKASQFWGIYLLSNGSQAQPEPDDFFTVSLSPGSNWDQKTTRQLSTMRKQRQAKLVLPV